MKKLLAILLCCGVAFPAMAKKHNKGFVFIPESVSIESVEDVKTKSDDTIVVMQGQIAKALGDEKYLFTDKTGEIIIEIDNEDFDGMTVSAGEIIEITGEVDKDLMKPAKVDVKSIKKIKEKPHKK